MTNSMRNLIGLIEIDGSLHGQLIRDNDATLGQSLARLAGIIGEPEEVRRTPPYTTQFLRADLDHLQGELEIEFQLLLKHLFEGE